VEYRFLTTDEDGSEAEVAAADDQEIGETYDEGKTVTLKGIDGVERAWKIVRTVEVPYTGTAVYVEPAD
jgi:hypothetical protein